MLLERPAGEVESLFVVVLDPVSQAGSGWAALVRSAPLAPADSAEVLRFACRCPSEFADWQSAVRWFAEHSSPGDFGPCPAVAVAQIP